MKTIYFIDNESNIEYYIQKNGKKWTISRTFKKLMPDLPNCLGISEQLNTPIFTTKKNAIKFVYTQYLPHRKDFVTEVVR